MAQTLYPRTTINSLLFEIKNYPYLRAIEDQQVVLSFMNYENISLYHDIAQLAQNEQWYKNELAKRDKEMLMSQIYSFEKDQLVAKLNAEIAQISVTLDKRLAINNYQMVDQMDQLFGGLSDTLIHGIEESIKTNKSLRNTISKMHKKRKSIENKYKNKIQILTENISDLKITKSELGEYCKKLTQKNEFLTQENEFLTQENEFLTQEHEIVEYEKNELARLQIENMEIETLCDSLRKSNTKLKLDNNHLHSTIMDLKIDLNDSRLDVEYFQEELEDIGNDKIDLKQSNEALQNTIIYLMMAINDSEQQVEYRDNDIAWYNEEYIKLKHDLMKLNNVVTDLKQSIATEIKAKSAYQTEFGVINATLTRKELEVTELRKQLKSLQRENSTNRTSFMISESIAKELRNKLKNIKSVTIAEPSKIQINAEIAEQNESSSTINVKQKVTEIVEQDESSSTTNGEQKVTDVIISDTDHTNIIELEIQNTDESDWAIY